MESTQSPADIAKRTGPGYTESMADEERSLSEAQRATLQQLIRQGDRGRAAIFIGRQAELALIRDRLETLLERQNELAPGVDLTTVIQGAPGAGKSALLARIADEWPVGREGSPVAVSLDPGVLKLPMAGCLQAIRAKVAPVPGMGQRLGTFVQSISLGVPGLAQVEMGVESGEEPGLPPVPVILLFDEIQTVLKGPHSDLSRAHLIDNLRLLHTGEHGAPLFPVYGGLANSGDLLRASGLTRLAMESERTLARLSADEVDELMTRFVDEHLSSARLGPLIWAPWGRALQHDSQGWPMHCRHFLIALAEAIRAQDWRPGMVDLESVRRRAQGLRCEYYEQRMQGELEGRHILISTVLEAVGQRGTMGKLEIIDGIERAHQDRPAGDWGRGALPEGMTAGQAFEALLHAGIVQKTANGQLACPIPSLSSHLAARATLPPSPLHDAILNSEMGSLDLALERCHPDEEPGRGLQATDRRGRTPLMLAVELGLASLVERLVQAESQLPPEQRSVSLRDHRGRTAQDQAMASGDERLMALLNPLQHLESNHTKPAI